MDESLSEKLNSLPDPWFSLRDYTTARIALGRVGTSIPLTESLNFRLSHANARDAVYSTLNTHELMAGIESLGLRAHLVRSKVLARREYLQRPDLGRNLSEKSESFLKDLTLPSSDCCVILSDGLSASAINEHALFLFKFLLPLLQSASITVAPVVVAENARVALGDEIGFLLKAKLTIMLIGERPGLSSPNSMGAYLTYNPVKGATDELRNCVSNIRPEGLSYQLAAEKIFYLVQESLRRKLSGVSLKDNSVIALGKKQH